MRSKAHRLLTRVTRERLGDLVRELRAYVSWIRFSFVHPIGRAHLAVRVLHADEPSLVSAHYSLERRNWGLKIFEELSVSLESACSASSCSLSSEESLRSPNQEPMVRQIQSLPFIRYVRQLLGHSKRPAPVESRTQ
jgi:hypothetical protein